MNFTSPAVFTIIDANGVSHESVSVYGVLGLLHQRGGRGRLERLIERATIGKPFTDAAEPVRGHVRAYKADASGTHNEHMIDLRHALLTAWS